ncbi:hypothetical protein AAKU67_002443 [Oxalobacteraceae bacterium GrIS 2.11]
MLSWLDALESAILIWLLLLPSAPPAFPWPISVKLFTAYERHIMNNLIKLSIIGALGIFSSVQASEIDRVTVTADKAESSLQQHYPMAESDFYPFLKTYELSNGMTLTLSNLGSLLVAQLNGGPKEHIVATSRHSFISKTSGLQLQIRLEDDRVSGEVYLPMTTAVSSAHYRVATFR